MIRKPRLFVEAKGLEENLSDRKWIAQVLGYATVAGVEWCVLSDGDEFRFYNATAPLDADEKLFCKLRLSEVTEAEAAKTLRLISRSNMEDNLLDVHWSAHFVDRQVRECLRTLIDSTDKRFLKLIRSAVPKLTSKEIADSIRRLDIRIDPPANLPDATGIPGGRPTDGDDAQPETRSAAAKRAWETRRSNAGSNGDLVRPIVDKAKGKKTRANIPVTLTDVIGTGILKPPLRLFRKYKGKVIGSESWPRRLGRIWWNEILDLFGCRRVCPQVNYGPSDEHERLVVLAIHRLSWENSDARTSQTPVHGEW